MVSGTFLRGSLNSGYRWGPADGDARVAHAPYRRSVAGGTAEAMIATESPPSGPAVGPLAAVRGSDWTAPRTSESLMSNKEEDVPVPVVEDALGSLIAHWRQRRARVIEVSVSDTLHMKDSLSVQVIPASGSLSIEGEGAPLLIKYPEVLLQAAVVVFGDKTNEGQLIQGVAIPWFEIIEQLERDAEFMFKIPWRKLEEIIAGAYERAGYPEVVLTPRSGDAGRDIIATKPGVGSIRIIDQVKAYKRGHRVKADEVRSLLGVLQTDRNVSKGVITTTSQFAPGIYKDEGLRPLMPYRLELKDGAQLINWLKALSSDKPGPA